MKKYPKYPKNFHYIGNGIDIENKTINKWIKECMDNMKGKKRNHSSMSSGNTQVIVLKYDDGSHEVIVTKNYSNWED